MSVLLTKNLPRRIVSLDAEVDAFLRRGDGAFLYIAPTRRKLRDLQRAGIMAWRVEWNDRWKDLGEMDIRTRCNTLTNILA